MRWVRYAGDDGAVFGIVEGDDVEEVSGSPFDGMSARAGGRRSPM